MITKELWCLNWKMKCLKKISNMRKMHWDPCNLNIFKKKVLSATNALKSWIIQVLSFDDPNYNTICLKAYWFDGQLDLLIPEPQQLIQGINKDMLDGTILHFLLGQLDLLILEPRQLIQGINKDMLDGTILHFLLVDANVTLLDRRNPMGEGSYGKIFKYCILRVDFVLRHEIYVSKVFNYLIFLMKVTLQHQETKKR